METHLTGKEYFCSLEEDWIESFTKAAMPKTKNLVGAFGEEVVQTQSYRASL